MGLANYIGNESVAVTREAVTGTVSILEIFTPGTTVAKSGDSLLVMSRASGRCYEITLTADIESTSTQARFSSVAFDTVIPAGSVLVFSQADKWDKINTSYQYQNFTGSISAGTAQNWIFGGQYGVTYHTWNRDSGDKGVTVGSSTMSVAKQYQHAGIRVPYDCTLVGFSGAGRNNNGNRQFAGGLFVGTPDWGATGTITPTLRAYAAADYSPGTSYTNRPVKVEDLSQSFEISAGDVIYPAIKSLDDTNDTIQLTFNLVLKTIKA